MPITRPSLSRSALCLTLLAAFLGWMFDGLEMGIFPMVVRPALQEMSPTLHGSELNEFVGKWMAWSTAFFLWGAALGGLVFGWLGDAIGRVRAMSLSVLTYSLFTAAAYFAREPWHLTALRFTAGLGMGGEWSLGVALVMEVWPDRARTLMASLIGAASNIGFAVAASLELVVPAIREKWRLILLVGALPAVLTFFIRFFVPESERWTASIEKEGIPHPLRTIFRPPLLRSTLLAIGLASVALIATWGAVQWLALWAPAVAGPGIPFVKNKVQIASALGATAGGFLGAGLGSMLGRRPAYFWLCALSLAISTWVFRTEPRFDGWFFSEIFLIGCFTASFYGWMPLYFPELFPTRVRATAQGLAYNFGRILAGAGALQMKALMQKFHGDYAKAGATVVLVYLAGMCLIWFAPETAGRPLPA